MGIGYVDSIVVYNRYATGKPEKEYYIGTRFDGVRIELTKGANVKESGMENADSCLVKIPNDNALPKPYKVPQAWKTLSEEDKLKYFTLAPEGNDFFSIVKKKELGIDVDLPVGLIESAQYNGGLYQHFRNQYGYTYAMNTVDVYNLIPRFEVSGK